MSRPSVNKRLREKARSDRQLDKVAKREQRKVEKAERPPTEPGVDPDIADIVPGPTPPPDWMTD